MVHDLAAKLPCTLLDLAGVEVVRDHADLDARRAQGVKPREGGLWGLLGVARDDGVVAVDQDAADTSLDEAVDADGRDVRLAPPGLNQCH